MVDFVLKMKDLICSDTCSSDDIALGLLDDMEDLKAEAESLKRQNKAQADRRYIDISGCLYAVCVLLYAVVVLKMNDLQGCG